ncbi:uncharacterized protein N7483_007577 [Penicillium malachiteum]|uniref:uncharacterized protein n=1 Tax=Penicillium malachiteum TaxID=1324776 RepID=UPI0025495020|nr:uncharacterized protein N7483_007577 [Penicillium malachiteum]KAJ5726220.1 hypothetical protein N7483_007577 [Penicillium malachiteum]
MDHHDTKESPFIGSRANVLMLHGHGQSGRTFQIKTRFLLKPLREAISGALSGVNDQLLPPGNIEFFYPDGTLPAQIPETHEHIISESEPKEDDEILDQWTWAYGDHRGEKIIGFEESIQYVLDLLHKHGPFIGIIGFSTGAALAAITASLLEQDRRVRNSCFEVRHPPLHFAVCYSGFKLSHKKYRSLYYPKIETPILHYIGTLDSWISESQTLKLAKRCRYVKIAYFMGTHFVPRSRGMLEILVHFVTESCGGREDESIESLESDWVDI